MSKHSSLYKLLRASSYSHEQAIQRIQATDKQFNELSNPITSTLVKFDGGVTQPKGGSDDR